MSSSPTTSDRRSPRRSSPPIRGGAGKRATTPTATVTASVRVAGCRRSRRGRRRRIADRDGVGGRAESAVRLLLGFAGSVRDVIVHAAGWLDEPGAAVHAGERCGAPQDRVGRRGVGGESGVPGDPNWKYVDDGDVESADVGRRGRTRSKVWFDAPRFGSVHQPRQPHRCATVRHGRAGEYCASGCYGYRAAGTSIVGDDGDVVEQPDCVRVSVNRCSPASAPI